jgi:hypothetical protein
VTWASLRVPAGLGVLVLTAALLFLASQRDPGYVRLSVAAATDGGTGHAARTFVVEAAPFSQVELRINGRRVTSAYVPGNARGVRFEDTPLEAGRNDVVAQATLWYAAVRRVHDATLAVDGAARAPAASRPAGRAARSGRVPPRAIHAGLRQLTIDVHFQEAAVGFTVRLARTDPAVISLLNGNAETAAFVDDVFGEPKINHAPLSRFFSGVPVRVREEDGGVTVSAASGYRRPGLEQLPALSGPLEIANADTGARVRILGDARDSDARGGAARTRRAWASDALRLTVADYGVTNAVPAPSRREGPAYVWDGPFRDGRRPVAVALTYAPFSSVTALRRGLNLSVFAFAHPIIARFLAFGHGFLLAIPMFAYLVLARSRTVRLAVSARLLIVVAVAADVFNACISSQPDVNVEVPLIAPALHGLTAPLLTQLVVPSVIGLVLAVIAASVAHLVERAEAPAGVLVFEGARAVSFAAAAYAAVVVVGYTAGAFARVPVLYPVLVGFLLAGVVVGLLRALGWWTIPDARRRHAFTAATVAGALIVAIPFSLVHYGAWAANPALTATGFASATSPLALATEFVRVLGLLSPFAFGLLLLRAMRADDAGIGMEQFARIAFCCYAVDVSGVVVLVPVSFVLAWTTFGWLRGTALAGIVPAGPPDAAAARFSRTAWRAVLPLVLGFASIDVALFVWFSAPHLGELHTPFIVLEAVVFVAIAVVSFAVPAIAFRASCENAAGAHALHRAMAAGVWVIACSLPAWFVRLETPGSLIAMVVVTAAFYCSLGFFLDAAVLRRTSAREAEAR